MFEYILKRLGLMFITALIIITIIFVTIRMMPDFDKPVLGQDPKIIERIRKEEGLDKSIPEQYGIWIKNIVTEFKWGWSTSKQNDVVDEVVHRIPVSASISIVPFLFSVPLGFGLGILAALRKNKGIDHVISLGVIFFISCPGFVVASLLQYYFAYELEWVLPFYAAKADVAVNPSLRFTTILLPWLSMVFGAVAGFTRFTRAELTEVLTSEFMLLCRTKGLTKRQATLRHAMRNSMVPLAPMIIGGLIGSLFGSLIVEKIYVIPGVANSYLEAFGARDYPLIMFLSVMYLVIGLLATLFVDISYSVIDPRIRVGGGKR
ncbi:ABC transporter permease [Mycoplasmatota bacterium]|nr:ABC transporter permease [Mycoplasmatota bacterium]